MRCSLACTWERHRECRGFLRSFPSEPAEPGAVFQKVYSQVQVFSTTKPLHKCSAYAVPALAPPYY